MKKWRALEAKADSLVQNAFAEEVRHSPLKGGVKDPERDISEFDAVLHVGGDDAVPGQAGSRYRVRIVAGQAELFIDRARYVQLEESLGLDIRVGDKIRANDRAGQPWFEVATISQRYSSLMVFSLKES